MNLGPLLEPRAVAIVGASAEPKKLSGMIVDFLAHSGYAGRIYPVNPRYPRIGTLACYPSVDALPGWQSFSRMIRGAVSSARRFRLWPTSWWLNPTGAGWRTE